MKYQDPRINLASKWIETFIINNKQCFLTDGITPTEIYKRYSSEVQHPFGIPTFFEMFHCAGMHKIRRGSGYVYVMFNKVD